MSPPLGVGILGAGLVTQAIHLPTLARLPDKFRVVTVMDVDAHVAEAVAVRAGAEPAQSVQAVLAHPGVDVVVVCSPPQFHAEQVAAICAAGKRGILCEKPLATTEAEAADIRKEVTAAEIPLVVGAMHAYDPGWLAALDACAGWLGSAHTIRSTIVLPFNDRFEDWATEVASRPAPPPPAGTLSAEGRAERIRGMVLGLLIHDLPLIRAFIPAFDQVDHAEFVSPFGGVISLAAGEQRIELIAFMRPIWQPDWRLEAWAAGASLAASFTPSYVHAGSARVTIRDGKGERQITASPVNGYEGEWRELHALVSGTTAPRYPLSQIVADLTFATEVAQGAVSAVLHGTRQ